MYIIFVPKKGFLYAFTNPCLWTIPEGLVSHMKVTKGVLDIATPSKSMYKSTT